MAAFILYCVWGPFATGRVVETPPPPPLPPLACLRLEIPEDHLLLGIVSEHEVEIGIWVTVRSPYRLLLPKICSRQL